MSEPVTIRWGPGAFVRAFEGLDGYMHVCISVHRDDQRAFLDALGLKAIEPRDHVPLHVNSGTFTLRTE